MKLVSYEGQNRLNTINGTLQNAGNAESYGGNQSGLNSLAAATGKALETYINIDKNKDLTNVANANTEYNREIEKLLSDKDTGLLNRKGENAQTILPEYTQKEQQIRQSIMDKYGFKMQDSVNAFQRMADNDATAKIGHIDKYMRQEFESSTLTAAQNRIDTISNNALLLGNMNDINKSFGELDNTLRAAYSQLGYDENTINDKIHDQHQVLSDSLVQKKFADNDIHGAREVIDYMASRGLSDEKTIMKYRAAAKEKELVIETSDKDKQKAYYDAAGGDPNKAAELMFQDLVAKRKAQGGKGTIDKLWKMATYAQEKYGYSAELLYRQLYHESAGGNSQLALENHNYAGLTQTTPNGEENKQPDGTNYYRMYKSDEEFVDSYVKDFLDHYGVKDAKTIEEYAQELHDGGYYTAPVSEYVNGMNGAPVGASEITDGEIAEFKERATTAMNSYHAEQKRIKAEELKHKQADINEKLFAMSKNGSTKAEQLDFLDSATAGEPELRESLMSHMITMQGQINAEKANASKAGIANMNMVKQAIANGSDWNNVTTLIRDSGLSFSDEQINTLSNYYNNKQTGKGEFGPEMAGLKGIIKKQSDNDNFDRNWLGVEEAIYPKVSEYMSEHGGQKPSQSQLIDWATEAMTTQSLILTGTGSHWYGGKNYEFHASPAHLRTFGIASVENVKGDDGAPYVRLHKSNGDFEDLEPATARERYGEE